MSAKQFLINSAVKHQVYLQRYAGSATRQLIHFIDNLKRESLFILDNTPDLTNISKARYLKLTASLQELRTALVKDMVKGIKSDMKNLAHYEADFTKRLIDQTIKPNVGFETVVPTLRQINSAAFTEIMGASIGYGTDGATVQSALQTFGSKSASQVTQAVRTGYALGKTTVEIKKNIIEILESRITDSRANTLARTITNHVASSSRQEFYKENSDIITGYQVVATLDDRTTLTCAALDGKIFPINEFEAPPYHWNCRTTFIGVVDPKYAIQLDTVQRPAKGDDGENLVSTQTTYNSWLKKQSDAFQNDVLGKERADLFRGGMNVDKFVDSNYKPISLDELKTKDKEYSLTP